MCPIKNKDPKKDDEQKTGKGSRLAERFNWMMGVIATISWLPSFIRLIIIKVFLWVVDLIIRHFWNS